MYDATEIGAKRLRNWVYFVVGLPFILIIPAVLLDIPFPLFCIICLVLSVIVARVTPVDEPVQTSRAWTLYSFVFTGCTVLVLMTLDVSPLPESAGRNLACRWGAGVVGALGVTWLCRLRRARRLRTAE